MKTNNWKTLGELPNRMFLPMKDGWGERMMRIWIHTTNGHVIDAVYNVDGFITGIEPWYGQMSRGSFNKENITHWMPSTVPDKPAGTDE